MFNNTINKIHSLVENKNTFDFLNVKERGIYMEHQINTLFKS